MSKFFGLQIEPNAQSAFQHDYWEEFSKVNDVFAHESDINVVQASKNKKKRGADPKPESSQNSSATKGERFKQYFAEKATNAKGLFSRSTYSDKTDLPETELKETRKHDSEKVGDLNTNLYPDLPEDKVSSGARESWKQGEHENLSEQDASTLDLQEEEEEERFISVAVQTEMSYLRDVEDPVSQFPDIIISHFIGMRECIFNLLYGLTSSCHIHAVFAVDHQLLALSGPLWRSLWYSLKWEQLSQVAGYT